MEEVSYSVVGEHSGQITKYQYREEDIGKDLRYGVLSTKYESTH